MTYHTPRFTSRRFRALPRQLQDQYIDRELRLQADMRKAHFDGIRERWLARNRHHFPNEAAAVAAYWKMRRAKKAA